MVQRPVQLTQMGNQAGHWFGPSLGGVCVCEGVWPQICIVRPEPALESFCWPGETDRGSRQVGGGPFVPHRHSTLPNTPR